MAAVGYAVIETLTLAGRPVTEDDLRFFIGVWNDSRVASMIGDAPHRAATRCQASSPRRWVDSSCESALPWMVWLEKP